ncbi:MAG: Xaa-Pro peptidase family protein [Candidatus Omnitrophica bacterium]|nr:Xaa-Pro peptidase family protein [Candidatus Omnitrophota bacterium]
MRRIDEHLKEANLDGLIVSSPANIHYLTDYPGRDAYLLVSRKECIYFTDCRYIEEAKLKLKDKAKVEKINGLFYKVIAEGIRNLGLKRVGFEARHLSFAEYKKIRQALLAKSVKLIPTQSLIEQLRQIKTKEEIDKIKKATDIALKALEFVRDFITPGRKELEIAAELERFIRYQGARSSAFEIIVASGPNSCFPHYLTGKRKIQKNEPLLIDLGVDYQGYKSDLTRVFFFGKINSLFARIYDIVSQAQIQAIRIIKPNIEIKKIDTASRQYITKKGFGKEFLHNLGHGIGLEVHELPVISPKTEGILKPGMVFTLEPAIYLKGKFGIRIEDMVLVTPEGCEVISGTLNK